MKKKKKSEEEKEEKVFFRSWSNDTKTTTSLSRSIRERRLTRCSNDASTRKGSSFCVETDDETDRREDGDGRGRKSVCRRGAEEKRDENNGDDVDAPAMWECRQREQSLVAEKRRREAKKMMKRKEEEEGRRTKEEDGSAAEKKSFSSSSSVGRKRNLLVAKLWIGRFADGRFGSFLARTKVKVFDFSFNLIANIPNSVFYVTTVAEP